MTPKRVRTVEGSCWACKDRRVICNLQRPQCSRCTSENQVCEYGKLRLRWCNGVAARGRFAGQNVPVSSGSPTDSKYSVNGQLSPSTLTSPSPSFSLSSSPLSSKRETSLELVRVADEEEGEEIQSPDTSKTCQFPEVPSLVIADELMLYFEHIVIDRFNLSTQPVLVDLVAVNKYPALRYSVTAVANAHQQLTYRPGQHDAFLSKRTARLKAIYNFRTQLENPTHHRKARRVPPLDLFLANVLLCILDGVIDPNDESAACHVHYRGGRAILSQWKLHQQLLQRHKRGLPALMLSCFATMDLTYSLLTGEEQYFRDTTWAHFAGSDGWWGVLPPCDPFLDIMRILSRLARLGHAVHSGSESALFGDELEALTMALRGYATPMDGLETLFMGQQNDIFALKPSRNTQTPLSPHLLAPMYSYKAQLELDESWTVFCNAYRLTGLIYIYRVFHRLDVSHPLVQQATSHGLRAICESRLKGKLAHCLLFPALVIGAHCRTAPQQKANLMAIRSTAAFLNFGSLKVMETFLRGLWARVPLVEEEQEEQSESWWECFTPIAEKTFLF
ncbi:hypothetical protein TMatcc_000740 [Talaromyces marneffei ATCC 18224]|uniref:Zn(2)-C6 fungal-type domain-containing protein n=2 Tax=Talaromyces marneffei TaxID=37727 RepID=B6QQY8_TALMQ|nr:uncharacterized protein EYB26_003300 [Talaromyces marneffei]EEA20751.1 hypothetical protein PMAA_045740 [Talaromyces marneffei ATCC 18224]KAE8549714.1 hypothetical protein EYB25_008238 [Talaromyces marneffei]QGA15640.1 hypothetical protein EYB26_003300 [Talaromyces marneffei]